MIVTNKGHKKRIQPIDCVCIGPQMFVLNSFKGSFSLLEDVGKLSLLCFSRIQISQWQSSSFTIGRLVTIEYFLGRLGLLKEI